MRLKKLDENLAYHAARILILIQYCGKPRRTKKNKLPGIEGRTLLAKLDFFLRYPYYLKRAASIREVEDIKWRKKFSNKDFGLETEFELFSVESQMVRYLYGPWDHVYYPVLAYLIGKQLIKIERGNRQTEIFRLTLKGQEIVRRLATEPIYEDLVQRAETIYSLFNKYTGNSLKNFIYHNFPDVVNLQIGQKI